MQEPQITFQPVVPVRATASDASEMVTQLLFGEEVLVLERDRQWLRIRAMADDYEGWIDEKAVLPATGAFADQVPGWTLVTTDHAMAFREYQGNTIPLRLPIAARWPQAQDGSPLSSFTMGNWTFRLPSDQSSKMGRTPPPSGPEALEGPKAPEGPLSTVNYQLSTDGGPYLGTPYLWGGRTQWGIDCSGFTQAVYRLSGISIPRDASQQAALGREVPYADRQAGDLAFFVNANGKVHHVGLVLADGSLRHAHGHVHDCQLTPQGVVSRYTQLQTHSLLYLKRIV